MDKKTKPVISILVPIYNVEKYLQKCLDSLISQSLKEIEIICIDDGSTDKSGEILTNFAEKDARIKIIKKKNTGYGDSMNRGLAAASGKYIGILEPDDYTTHDAFLKMVNIAEKFSAEVVRANYYHLKNGATKKYNSNSSLPTNKIINPKDYPKIFFQPPAIWSAIYQRDFLEKNKINFLPTAGAAYQDTSFNFKVMTIAKRMVLLDVAFVHYRLDNENSSVNSVAKMDAVVSEFWEIERFLKSKDPKLLPLMETIKFRTYFWNIQRLNPELARQFIGITKIEFRNAFSKKIIEQKAFSKKDWLALKMILELPDGLALKLIQARKKIRR